MNYGARAKEWIVDHDVKQKMLAKEFHVTESILSQYLTGKSTISIDVLVKIAQYFGLSMDYLVGLTDDPNPPYPVSAGERAMLESFRSLSREQKELILQNIEFMRRQNQGQ